MGLRAPDGSLTRTGCPPEEAVDGRIELREGIRQATEYPAFVSGVLISPDIRRDKDMARAALNHDLARTIRGLDTLQEDPERITEVVGFRWPPSARHSENEWRRVNELRYHPAGGTQRDAGHRTPYPAEGRDAVEVAELPLPVGSATFNIRRLDKLVAQHFHPERDADGRTALPQSSITKRPASVSAASSTSIRCRADALCPVLSGAQFFRYIHGYIFDPACRVAGYGRRVRLDKIASPLRSNGEEVGIFTKGIAARENFLCHLNRPFVGESDNIMEGCGSK